MQNNALIDHFGVSSTIQIVFFTNECLNGSLDLGHSAIQAFILKNKLCDVGGLTTGKLQ